MYLDSFMDSADQLLNDKFAWLGLEEDKLKLILYFVTIPNILVIMHSIGSTINKDYQHYHPTLL